MVGGGGGESCFGGGSWLQHAGCTIASPSSPHLHPTPPTCQPAHVLPLPHLLHLLRPSAGVCHPQSGAALVELGCSSLLNRHPAAATPRVVFVTRTSLLFPLLAQLLAQLLSGFLNQMFSFFAGFMVRGGQSAAHGSGRALAWRHMHRAELSGDAPSCAPLCRCPTPPCPCTGSG